jgi:hypothetical protein
VKGLGMQAKGLNGSTYVAGSYTAAKHLTDDAAHMFISSAMMN